MFLLRKSTSMQLNKLCEAHSLIDNKRGKGRVAFCHLNIKGILHLFLTSCTIPRIYFASELFLHTSKEKIKIILFFTMLP